jgi:hypothetical protein
MSDQSTLFAEEHLAKISQSLVSEQEWTETVVNSPLNSLDLLRDYGPDGWSGRTSPACCRLMEDERLEPFSDSWGNSGMGSLTEFLTLSTAEYHSDGVGSSLSDILETGEVQQRYYLSATACRGILRRAKKRGKALPDALRVALESVAGPILQMETEEDLSQELLDEDMEIEEETSTEQGRLFPLPQPHTLDMEKA